jgi:hypothetical protein
MKYKYAGILVTCVLVTFPDVSHAYVGPGTGLSAIGTVIAFIGSLFLLIVGFVWYPIKRFLKGKKAAQSKEINRENSSTETTEKNS